MSAVISDCGNYRYVLRRSLGSLIRWYKPCLFIMLNPSTADAEKDDATIRRCISFTKREGRTHLTVVNLFAFRATNPKKLFESDDPVGPENDKYLIEEIKKHDLGAQPNISGRVKKLITNGILGRGIQCLGKTKKGFPRHPLYLKKDTKLENITFGSMKND